MVKTMKNKKAIRLLCALMTVSLGISPMQLLAQAAETERENTVLINEIESDDPNGGNDWVEIINAGTSDADISGWFVTDDKALERQSEGKTFQIAEGTVLKAGEVLVLEDSINFDFGLGKEDTVNLYNADAILLDTYSWSGHADGTYSRVVGGNEFVDQAATKGAVNTVESGEEGEGSEDEAPQPTVGTLVINEVNSSPDDWVELMNIGNEAIELTGYELRDNSDDHRWQFAEGTTVAAGELIVVKANTAGLVFDDAADTYVTGIFDEAIGIGSGDSIRLYDASGELLDSHTWTEHANIGGDESASWGRYPDGVGSFVLMPESAGVSNSWYAPELVINEVESNGEETDWVEVYNAGSSDIDLSGWYILDNDPVGHLNETTPLAEGTLLKAGAYFVFDQNVNFLFGLGKEDSVTVYNKDGVAVAAYAWTSHAEGVYARIPDGSGEFVDFEVSTKGKANVLSNPVILNEIQSNDPKDGPDWIELANPTDDELNISGIVIKDDDDTHEYVIPEGTVIPANGFIVITGDEFGFGLGKNDSVRRFETVCSLRAPLGKVTRLPLGGFIPI